MDFDEETKQEAVAGGDSSGMSKKERTRTIIKGIITGTIGTEKLERIMLKALMRPMKKPLGKRHNLLLKSLNKKVEASKKREKQLKETVKRIDAKSENGDCHFFTLDGGKYHRGDDHHEKI
jgi:hypothetical protein